MTLQSQWPMPTWLAQLPDVEQKEARTRFLLCLAAAYAQDRGNISRLARALGTSVQAVHSASDRGQVSLEMAAAIEDLLGRDLFPRELFRPDLYPETAGQ